MGKTEAFFELGDFMVEFGDHYLGYAQVNIELQAVQHSIRKDAWQLLKLKQIAALKWSITVELANGEKWWKLLCGSADCSRTQFVQDIFARGGVLRLYPADPSRSGFEFKRVFVDRVKQQSGRELECGSLKVVFDCEASLTGNYFSFLTPGTLPAGAQTDAPINIDDLSLALVEFLGKELDAVPDQTIRLNSFAPGNVGSYMLALQSCREWAAHQPHWLKYTLTARFPMEEKNEIDRKLLAAAHVLHDYRLPLGGIAVPGCKTNGVYFSKLCQVNSNTFCCSTLDFCVLLQ